MTSFPLWWKMRAVFKVDFLCHSFNMEDFVCKCRSFDIVSDVNHSSGEACLKGKGCGWCPCEWDVSFVEGV